MTVYLLSAGAAKGLVSHLEEEFRAATGSAIAGTFSAVGAIEQRFLGGDRCDMLILTARQIRELAESGYLLPDTIAAIGGVQTSIAVPMGHYRPPVSTSEQLRAAFALASALYVPDMKNSTAGRHVRATLDALDLGSQMQTKLREFPNGETAMRALAADAPPSALGCTQITEILNTPGLTPVGPLPAPHQLATVYTAAVSATSVRPDLARDLVALLTSKANTTVRRQCGFQA